MQIKICEVKHTQFFYVISLQFSNLVIKMLVLIVLKVGKRLLRFYNLPQIQDKLLPLA